MVADEDTAAKQRDDFLSAIADERFPCVGAKSALANGMLKTIVCRSLESTGDDSRIHSELVAWAERYRAERRPLRSLAVIFDEPREISEVRFEQLMWERLESLAQADASSGHRYDSSVSPHPDDPHFALSFGGAAFFVVGLHPGASRPARRAAHPTLVFNLHDQFEQLRAEGTYERMRDTIIRRDVALAGSANPMLARFGEASGARQYSGRAVGADWRCPFRDPRAA